MYPAVGQNHPVLCRFPGTCPHLVPATSHIVSGHPSVPCGTVGVSTGGSPLEEATLEGGREVGQQQGGVVWAKGGCL